MMYSNKNCNISFKAQIGPKLNKCITKEFNYSNVNIDKFKKLFSDTFEKILDKDTVIDIDKNKNWIFSHSAFSDIKFCKKNFIDNNKAMWKNLILECSKVMGNGEFNLFRNIISKFAQKGVGFDKLRQMANSITSQNSKKTFLQEISVAEQIKIANPSTKYRLDEFSNMTMKMYDENFDKAAFEVTFFAKIK